MASGLVARHGLREVAFAGYPEGHPRIASRTLDEALRAKVALARRQGLEVSLVTQFGFDAAPILRWIAALRAQDIACPVRVGIAGPATVATLAKFAVRCGIGASLRALARGHTAFARILAEAGPDALIGALVAEEDARLADRRPARLHLWRRPPRGGMDRRLFAPPSCGGRACAYIA